MGLKSILPAIGKKDLHGDVLTGLFNDISGHGGTEKIEILKLESPIFPTQPVALPFYWPSRRGGREQTTDPQANLDYFKHGYPHRPDVFRKGDCVLVWGGEITYPEFGIVESLGETDTFSDKDTRYIVKLLSCKGYGLVSYENLLPASRC